MASFRLCHGMALNFGLRNMASEFAPKKRLFSMLFWAPTANQGAEPGKELTPKKGTCELMWKIWSFEHGNLVKNASPCGICAIVQMFKISLMTHEISHYHDHITTAELLAKMLIEAKKLGQDAPAP